MIDVSRRLRRAILLNDIALVKRIVRNNPESLVNPDFGDKSNTSLHLAAKAGFVEIADFLISSGHEDEGISRNADWDTPLMLAAAAGKVEVGQLLVEKFPRSVPWTNKRGMDALMLSSRSGTLDLIPPLLNCSPPSSVTTFDADGNTALHHASACGELKTLRLLLKAGAPPVAQNAYGFTPISYSASQQAEAYFKSLVLEFEKNKAKGARDATPGGAGPAAPGAQAAPGMERSQSAQSTVQIVPSGRDRDNSISTTSTLVSTASNVSTAPTLNQITSTNGPLPPPPPPSAPSTAPERSFIGPTAGVSPGTMKPLPAAPRNIGGSRFRNLGGVRLVTSEDGEGLVATGPAPEWSPVEQRRRAMTPTTTRPEGWGFGGEREGGKDGSTSGSLGERGGGRVRASSGD